MGLLDARARHLLLNSLERLGTWWIAELSGLCPRPLLDWLLGASAQRLWLTSSQTGVVVDVASTSQNILHHEEIPWTDYSPARLGAFLGARPLPMVLRLPATSFFSRSFVVPAIALPQLPALANQEIERRTPFQLDDILVGHHTQPDPVDRHKLAVIQRIIRRDLVEAACAPLGLNSSTLSFIASEDDEPDISRAIALGPSAARSARWNALLIKALAIAALLLAAAGLGGTWWNQDAAIAAATAKLPALQARAEAIRHTLDDATRARASIQSLLMRRRSPRALQAWEEISRLLPDDSWLTELRIEGDRLAISGLSTNAAGLVELLGKSALLEDVALNAPITSDSMARRDRFSLIARIRGRALSGG
ncbi:PilN domain-containing protein [Bradyrhizobium brasilense]|uniref:PilN domain-containing protein n=1 Tax=Bradyrhizobium brasilense TaxID=1419277 RepID=A0ABY8JM81_9BRAD|nr:PilN domain-containing protein [Bradyrhizobium brasilense]WFU66685.1 PilN domain-containing protein [Bradyrhizobium brasilense]